MAGIPPPAPHESLLKSWLGGLMANLEYMHEVEVIELHWLEFRLRLLYLGCAAMPQSVLLSLPEPDSMLRGDTTMLRPLWATLAECILEPRFFEQVSSLEPRFFEQVSSCSILFPPSSNNFHDVSTEFRLLSAVWEPDAAPLCQHIKVLLFPLAAGLQPSAMHKPRRKCFVQEQTTTSSLRS
eukprot:CAMPEP_0115398154 /NCGR_PEP_ID=MMETSP0271-20121206/14176_1 /TAXON_ID=71861 /ORGANISM="Scrippsiella trochoidea, Strain CCMP3099" /LENGTH=181 /DNA_ID=CAMNT_0002821929 /DNA_START=79 /DNA_END=626 /DNA_ORIENTATION=+